MRIAMLQYPCSSAYDRWEKRILEAKQNGAELVIMPELFCNLDRPPVEDWAKKYDVALVGSMPESDEGELRNFGFFCHPDGHLEGAGKRHLFAWEKQKFQPGDKPAIVEYKGWKIRILVCFDVRFPVWSRNRSGWDYDLAIYVANFPQERIHEWDLLLKARSIENQAYVCGVNRTGTDRNDTVYDGHSAVYLGAALQTPIQPNPQTEPRTEEGIYYADLDLDRIVERRNIFPSWKVND